MPVTPTYPGVYIEEVPSGVRTITGVATSITAFAGRARRGPVDEPVFLNSYGDFERVFGGLWAESTLGYAVRDFYRNGGAQAVVVRVFRPAAGANPPPGVAALDVGGVRVLAAHPGAWGNDLRVRVEANVPADVAARYGLVAADMFTLLVRDGTTGEIEVLRNLSMKESARRADRVLASESNLVRLAAVPVAPFTVPTAHPAPVAGQSVFQDPLASSAVAAAPPADRGADGQALDAASFNGAGFENDKRGLYALKKTDLFNLLVLPPYLADGGVDNALVADAAKFCEDRRAFMIVDPPAAWVNKDAAKAGIAAGVGTVSCNAAVFFPRLTEADPLRENGPVTVAPGGAVAGIFARTDAQRGVWKAPAGLEASLSGVSSLSVRLTDGENGELNPLGVNCLRAMPGAGPVVWGSRTLQGDDRLASEWKYVPVRRLALFLEESLYRGTQWVVFEPNDEPLWAQIRLNVGAFMHNLFVQGAFQGKTPREAYLVKCDRETTSQYDIDRGVVNVVVGFAPLKPAEFVILKIQQLAGQAVA